MELIVFLISIFIFAVILAVIFVFNLKKIKTFAENKHLLEIATKFPDNIDICKSMLAELNNKKVKIKENKDSKNATSLYIAITDTILIANIKDRFTRIQTIAHECLHSIQNRRVLLFNFIFTNIYMIYFVIVTILTLIGIIKNYNTQTIIIVLMGFVQYAVRSYLETDAMVKAEYFAEEYMKEYINENKVCTLKEVEELTQACKKVNKIGIPMYNMELVIKAITKPIIYMTITFILMAIQK